MLASAEQAKSCRELYEEFLVKRGNHQGEKLIFSGVGTRDVYNITAPFMDDGEPVIAGRVEDRDKEASEIMFFVNRQGEWVPRPGSPVFVLQDPFVSFVQGEIVFGGVEVYFDAFDPHFVTSWRTVFYRGKRIGDLQLFAKGPLTMKDIRLVDLGNGRIGVFTRPMMVEGARAMIGYTEIADLSELTEEVIDRAELLRNQFLPEEWGGANEAHMLSNGIIGVLGHVARMENTNIRHYYPMTFAFDPATRTHSRLKLIASRDMFPEGPAKRPDLEDVLFSGGLVRIEGGSARIYTGVSDAEAHTIVIPDPFIEYEQ
ncbi:DUF1861 family protein [Cohnella pontilimi]|uniref:DUF1861 family protein n=1 Tax=Cohnella pontilimi TaxID=2564100 RepID=A0A4U0FBY3_9BACL|nr:DUF1861 family protein [Cohnella pontilimi]TJY42356.1 DUF1861 family protein [Cohnella pontilimi]